MGYFTIPDTKTRARISTTDVKKSKEYTNAYE